MTDTIGAAIGPDGTPSAADVAFDVAWARALYRFEYVRGADSRPGGQRSRPRGVAAPYEGERSPLATLVGLEL